MMFRRGFDGYGNLSGYTFGTGDYIMMGIRLLIFIIIVAALIFLALKLIKALSTHAVFHSSSKAMDILNERYAKGEIDEEEYMKKKNILNPKN